MNFLYIDPGTGSMLFSILIGLATTLVFAFRALIIKIKFLIGRGKKSELEKNHLGIVIFSDGKQYWNVFGPICREADSRALPLVYMTQSRDDPAFNEKFNFVKTEFIGEGNKGITLMNFLNADIVLATTPNLDVFQWKKSRNVKYYVHIPHSITALLGYRMFALDFYDAVFLTGDFCIDCERRLEKMRDIKQKELTVVGYPPLDEMKNRLENYSLQSTDAKAEKEKTILIAPSWGQGAILSRYGEKFLNATVATGYKIIVRPHPQSKTSEKEMLDDLMKKFPTTENFEWNFDNDNFDCMNTADLLITDFSGIIFDFALVFNKPFFYADSTFDPSICDAAWFPDEEKLDLVLGKSMGIKLEEKDFPNLKSVIDNAVSSSELENARKTVSSKVWQHKGESAKRVVDYLEEKQQQLTQKDATKAEKTKSA